MNYVAPFPQPSPAPSFLSVNYLRLVEQDLASVTSLCFSPVHHNRTPFTELLQSKSKNQSPLQSPRCRAVSSPRSLLGLGSDARARTFKENRPFAQGEPPKNGDANRRPIERKKPAKLVIPESAKLASLEKVKQFALPEQGTPDGSSGFEAAQYAVSCKRGRKDFMEDAHTASTHFRGNSKQAFFGVFDGHGGKHAADFAAATLGEHISLAIKNKTEGKGSLEDAMHEGFMTADAEYLGKHLGGGACAVSAFVKEGEMVVANAGDCKAVLSRAGKAESLSTIHRASIQAEQRRVEDLGGFVDCFNGIWRLQGTLAVTRGFGDATLKQWVSAEPATKRIDITHDCEFLILASDGLWDQVRDQEAVDCARKILVEAGALSNNATRNMHIGEEISKAPASYHRSKIPFAQNKEDHDLQANASLQNKIDITRVSTHKINACSELIRIAGKRGNQDDITVMIVLLQDFAIA